MSDSHYNRANYPRLVWAHRDYPWHVWASPSGQCAAIPVNPESGHMPSGFGNLAHLAKAKRRAAYVELGKRAARAGVPWHKNPYESGGVLAYLWDSGHTFIRQGYDV